MKLLFAAGMHVSAAAQELVDAVAGGAAEAEGDFNDITLRAVAGTTAAEIEAFYDREIDARAEAYRSSPAGIAAAQRRRDGWRTSQKTADDLMVELKTLDFSSDVAVLDWLGRFQEPSDHVGVLTDGAAVVEAFTDRGYGINVNLGDDFNENDRDNYARYLVGQALSMLQGHGAIHGMYGTFHERWKAKFLATTGDSQ